MKQYKLAEGTIDVKRLSNNDRFLKKRKKTLTQSLNTKKFEKNFQNI